MINGRNASDSTRKPKGGIGKAVRKKEISGGEKWVPESAMGGEKVKKSQKN